MIRITLLFFSIFYGLIGYSQSEIDAPFKIKVKVKKASDDSAGIIKVRIRNLSTKTFYISNYPAKYINPIDSIGYISLNYSENYSDPLLMPDLTVAFFKLKPFRSIVIERQRLINSINILHLDFEFIAKDRLNKKNRELILENRNNDTLVLTHQEFFNDIWYADKATRVVEYLLKTK